MSANFKIAVLGGDKRIRYVAEKLAGEGYEVITYAVEGNGTGACAAAESLQAALKESDLLIGPIPFTQDGITLFSKTDTQISLTEFCENLNEFQIVTGGNIPESVWRAAVEKQAAVYDFMKLNDVAIKNAVATAEGTIAEAIILSDRNLNKSQCLVLGYGKCGRALAYRLKGMGAHVTVAARRQEQRLEAAVQGMSMLDSSLMIDSLTEYDFIFNTIPFMILDRQHVGHIRPDALIIDIASKPGGTDFEACRDRGIQAVLALGLPGKYSPETSAEILIESIRHLLPTQQC